MRATPIQSRSDPTGVVLEIDDLSRRNQPDPLRRHAQTPDHRHCEPEGGVGKTTTAINLGTALAATDKHVVIFDLDPQGNASTGLGIPAAERRPNAYHVLLGEAGLAAATRPTLVPKLFVVPSGVDLSGAEVELVGLEGRSLSFGKRWPTSTPPAITS